MSTVMSGIQNNINGGFFFETLKSLDSQCKSCTPITPLECLTRCKVYKLKNELRLLRKSLDNADYIKDLFNALKNETILFILQALVNDKYSVGQLQVELKKAGYNHSKSAISKEYLQSTNNFRSSIRITRRMSSNLVW